MRGPLTPERIEEIEETLIRADLGVDVAARIATVMGEGRYHDLKEVQAVLAAEVEKIMAPVAQPLAIGGGKPFVILVVGVNGSGKTTTIGKLAAQAPRRGQERDALRRRHVPRRRDRSAEDLGRPLRRDRCSRASRAPTPPGSPTTRSRRRAARRSTCCWSTPPAACRTRRC